MKISDTRWKGQQTDARQITINKEEMETTINKIKDEETIEVYSSIPSDITKILKITEHENISVLSISKTGKITSLRATLNEKQLLLRTIPKQCIK